MKQLLLLVAGGLSLAALACTGGAPAREAAPALDPAALTGIEWRLREIRTPERTVSLDRGALEAEGMGGFFTLTFTGEDQASGVAAPNRYTAPCAWGDDNALSLGPAAVTRMFAFKEPEALREAEFLDYLFRVSRWVLGSGGQLELWISGETGSPQACLIFDRAAP